VVIRLVYLFTVRVFGWLAHPGLVRPAQVLARDTLSPRSPADSSKAQGAENGTLFEVSPTYRSKHVDKTDT
jgi:hypothetical protein